MESVESILERLGHLNKVNLTSEAEGYGLEVDPSWTKAEILSSLKEHLEEPDPEEPDIEEDDVPSPADPTPLELEEAPQVTEVLSRRYVSWGRNPGSRAP